MLGRATFVLMGTQLRFLATLDRELISLFTVRYRRMVEGGSAI